MRFIAPHRPHRPGDVSSLAGRSVAAWSGTKGYLSVRRYQSISVLVSSGSVMIASLRRWHPGCLEPPEMKSNAMSLVAEEVDACVLRVIEQSSRLPEHLGVILDGNRRWARRHGLDELEAYRRSAAKVEHLLSWCDRAGIDIVTIWVLSVDNLQRGPMTVQKLVDVIIRGLQRMAAMQCWRFHVIGDLSMIPAPQVAALRAIEAATADVQGLQVNVALAYGGRQDIVAAVQGLLAEYSFTDATTWVTDAKALEERLSAHLSTAGQPDPDLIIRTSGEYRTSGFLLWQSAQSELYFTTTEWPDFTEADLNDALQSYSRRDRRFGR